MLDNWHHWVGTFTGVCLITLAALPLAALAVCGLAYRRRVTGATPAWAWRMSVADVGIVYGTAPWIWMTMLPGDRAGVSLIPLRDLVAILTDRGPVELAGQVAGNLLVFAALGFFAPLRCTALASVPRILALGAGCSILVETAQYVLQLDRVSSVDDVLLNTIGAALAALASRPWWHARTGEQSHVLNISPRAREVQVSGPRGSGDERIRRR